MEPDPGSRPPDDEFADPVEALLFQCLERDACRPDRAIEDACALHPELAPTLRRRYAEILALGIAEEPQAEPDSDPERFGDYRILRRLGSGGMGVVYLAEQRAMGRRVALKLLHPGQLHFGPARERFDREIHAVSRLDHPGICTVYEAGTADGTPFIAMRYVDGENLAERIARLRSSTNPDPRHLADGLAHGPESEPSGSSSHGGSAHAIAWLVERLARAVHTAHEAGLVHRDIKPANVMITAEGDPVLLDFGLARDDTVEGAELTRSGDVLGTPSYLAPEQVQARRGGVDRRADVHALGVLLYECLTLRCPFESTSREELYRQILGETPPNPRRFHRGLSPDLRAILDRALEKDPRRRYRSALELAEDLRRVRSSQPVAARRIGPVGRATRWARRHPAATAIIVLLSVGLATTIALLREVADQRRRARALALASLSAEALETDTTLALLLARAAVDLEEGAEEVSRLHAAVTSVRERAILTGHGGQVWSAEYSSDGALLLTASLDHTARLWRADGEFVRAFRHPERVQSAAFDPDPSRRRFVTAGFDGIVRLWSLDAEEPLWAREHGDGPIRAGFAPAGDRILSWATTREFARHADGPFDDFSAKLWSLDGQPVGAAMVHESMLEAAVFSPSGHRVATASRDGTVRVWDERGAAVGDPLRHELPVISVAWATDGCLATGCYDGCVRIWTLGAPEIACRACEEGHEEQVTGLGFSPDGELLVSTSDDCTAKLWNRRGENLATMRHEAGVQGPEFAPRGDRFATAGLDQTVRVFDRTGALVDVLRGHDDVVVSARFAPDGRQVVTASEDRTARVWSVGSTDLPILTGHGSVAYSARMSRDGRRILTASREGRVRLWDVEGGECTVLWEGDKVQRAVFAPSETSVLFACYDGHARRLDLEGRVLAEFEPVPGKAVLAAEFSPDGSRVLVAAIPGVVQLYALDGTPIGPPLEYEQPVYDVEFAADGSFGVARLGAIHLYDAEARPRGAPIPVHFSNLAWLSFSLDGKQLLTAIDETTAAVLDLDGRQVVALHGHEGEVTWGEFSPHGDRIVTASRDRTARLWDRSGRELAVLRGHRGAVFMAAFSPAGDRVLTAAFDGTVRTWMVHTGDLRKLAAELSCRDFTAAELEQYGELLGKPADRR
ncbi:MAG: serine/threonine protein kinase [Planctomycetes bacterium]|nr:serine/threonine protein kinase [Planctomycetota bacterium]